MPDVIREFRVSGSQSFAKAVDDVDDCLRLAIAEGARRVLVDVSGLTGFAKPDVVARAGMIRKWAATTQGRLKVALISPAHLNDGERFDVVLAQAMGFDGDVFENEDDARHWLELLPETWR